MRTIPHSNLRLIVGNGLFLKCKYELKNHTLIEKSDTTETVPTGTNRTFPVRRLWLVGTTLLVCLFLCKNFVSEWY